MFSLLVNFAKFLKTTFSRTPPYGCFWIEYKCNNTKMIQINQKHNYTYPISSNLKSKCRSSLLLKTTYGSSCFQMFVKKVVLKNFPIFTGKNLCWNNFIKKRLQLRFFPMNIANSLRTAFFIENLKWLFLDIYIIF